MVADVHEGGHRRNDEITAPTYKLGDLTVQLRHTKGREKPESHWNSARKKINWNNLCYVMEEQNGMQIPIGFKEKQEFISLRGKKLLFESTTHYDGLGAGSVFGSRGALTTRWNSAMENEFDILAWMNCNSMK